MPQPSFNHLSPEDFLNWKKEDRNAVLGWIYPVAKHAVDSFLNLTEDERSDAVTQSIERIYAAMDTIDSPGQFIQFVRRTVKNRAIDILRQKRRRQAREVSLDAGLDDTEQSGALNEVAHGEMKVAMSAFVRQISEMEIRDYRRLLDDTLNPEDLELCNLIERGLTPSEICSTLKVTLTSFYARKSRLKTRVQQIFRTRTPQ